MKKNDVSEESHEHMDTTKMGPPAAGPSLFAVRQVTKLLSFSHAHDPASVYLPSS